MCINVTLSNSICIKMHLNVNLKSPKKIIPNNQIINLDLNETLWDFKY